MKRPTVLIADDHAVVVEGLRHMLESSDYDVVGTVNDGRALLCAARRLRPEVIITDIAMPLLNGIDAAREIRQYNRIAKIVFLTMHPEVAYAAAALESGASGYVVKSSAGGELITALREVLDGHLYVSKSIAEAVDRARKARAGNPQAIDLLTHRQREVLQLLAEGKRAKEIAAILKLSPKTVEFHKYRIMDLLGIRTIAELARHALKHGNLA